MQSSVWRHAAKLRFRGLSVRRFCDLPLQKMTIVQLRSLAGKIHVDLSDCLDKSDMVDKLKIAKSQENEMERKKVKVEPVSGGNMGFANPLGEQEELKEDEIKQRKRRMQKEAQQRRAKEDAEMMPNRPKEFEKLLKEEEQTGNSMFESTVNRNLGNFQKTQHEWSQKAYEHLRKKRNTNENYEETLRGMRSDLHEDTWFNRGDKS